ncbi:hypothetical protein JTB14_021384 [Gonioctena quinquepunctata]|nr:hypothetical protein JTB14_021384 [Gonioctena quinquepunctata]
MNVESGHIWEAPNEYDIILPCNAKFGSLENEVSSAITKFGGEDGLRRQNKTKGDVAMMLHSLGFPREDGSFLCSPRYIYYPITTDGIGTKEAEDIDVFQSIVQIRNHILKNKKTKVALPELNGVGGMMLGRIVEYLFVNTNVEVKIYKPVKSQKLPTQDSTQANSQSSKQNTAQAEISWCFGSATLISASVSHVSSNLYLRFSRKFKILTKGRSWKRDVGGTSHYIKRS